MIRQLRLAGRAAPRPGRKKRPGSRGTILIATMWVVLVLAGLVLVFAHRMRVEVLASANQLAAAQAEWVARAGLAFMIAQVNGTDGTWSNDEALSCEAVPVGNGYFWLLHPDPEDDWSYRFGITDESSRLNLNYATEEMLLMFNGLTEELAAALIDWRNPDAEAPPIEGGAKSEYYLLRSPAYNCKSGPLETIEEILMIKGASPEILFGEDLNRNGVLDPNEDDGDENPPADNRDGQLDRGIYPFITVYSEAAAATGGRNRPTSPINVNTAPREVLQCLPGLDQADVDALLTARAAETTNLENPDWVNQALPAAKAAAIRNWITVQSYRFSADIVAVSGDGRAFKRFRAVVDARTRPPRVLAWQELTGLGWPLDPQVLNDLRSGKEPPVINAISDAGGVS
ncbi:MAG TPA: type II secretion system protein GspK [bacterium]|nr:type II secretion system protein GspK [bacterium]HNS49128.1 type II secretion system protein GspK [bacterium]